MQKSINYCNLGSLLSHLFFPSKKEAARQNNCSSIIKKGNTEIQCFFLGTLFTSVLHIDINYTT